MSGDSTTTTPLWSASESGRWRSDLHSDDYPASRNMTATVDRLRKILQTPGHSNRLTLTAHQDETCNDMLGAKHDLPLLRGSSSVLEIQSLPNSQRHLQASETKLPARAPTGTSSTNKPPISASPPKGKIAAASSQAFVASNTWSIGDGSSTSPVSRARCALEALDFKPSTIIDMTLESGPTAMTTTGAKRARAGILKILIIMVRDCAMRLLMIYWWPLALLQHHRQT